MATQDGDGLAEQIREMSRQAHGVLDAHPTGPPPCRCHLPGGLIHAGVCPPAVAPDIAAQAKRECAKELLELHRPDGDVPGPGAMCVYCTSDFGTPAEDPVAWPCRNALIAQRWSGRA